MSSTGVDKARSSNERIADNTIDITKQIIEDTKVFNSTSPEFALSGEQGSSEGTAAGNYLAKSGDVRLGPMGNEFRIVEIIDGEISVSIATANYVPWIILNPEGGSPDDLETIFPGESIFFNQEIVLQGGNMVSDITLKNSDNIITPDGQDLTLAFGKIVRLYYSQLLSSWIVAWISSGSGGGGGGGFTDPLRQAISIPTLNTPPTTTVLNIDSFTEFLITLDKDIKLEITGTVPAGKDQNLIIKIIQDNTTKFTVDWSGIPIDNIPADPETGSFNYVVIHTMDQGTTFDLVVTKTGSSSSVANWANFEAVNDVNFATFDGINIDRLLYDQAIGSSLAASSTGTTSNANGDLLHNVIVGGFHTFKSALIDIAQFDDGGGLKMLGTHNIIMNKNIINQIGKLEFDNTLAVAPAGVSIDFNNVSDALVHNVPLTTDKHFFNINNELMVSIFRDGLNSGTIQVDNVIGDKVIQANEIIDLSTFTNSSPTNGNFWLDLTTGLFQFRENGITQSLGATPNSISQGDSNVTVTDAGVGNVSTIIDGIQKISVGPSSIDYNGVNFLGLESLFFASAVGSSVITPSLTGVIWNFPDNTDDFAIHFNGVQGFIVDEFITRVSSTTPNTTKAVFSLFRDDPSPIAIDEISEIQFQGRNSIGSLETYGSILSLLIDPTNGSEQADMFLKTLESGVLVSTFGIGGGSATIRHLTSFSSEFARLRLQKEDTSPGTDDLIGIVDFDILDSGVPTNYARIEGLIDNALNSGRIALKVLADSSLIDGLLISGDSNNAESFLTVSSLIDSSLEFGVDGGAGGIFNIGPIQSGLGANIELGIVVQDNVSYTIGSNGTIALPSENLQTTPTKAQLDTAYGTHLGAFGFDIPSFPTAAGDSKLFVRLANGDWVFWNNAGIIQV